MCRYIFDYPELVDEIKENNISSCEKNYNPRKKKNSNAENFKKWVMKNLK